MLNSDNPLENRASAADSMSLSKPKSCLKMRVYAIILPIFCICPSLNADELSDLKERLQAVEEERQGLRRQIRMLEPDAVVENDNEADREPGKAPDEDGIKTKASLKLYWDTREYSTFGVYNSATGLPLGLTFWGFTDLHGNQHRGDDSFSFDRYFMEYRLSRAFDPEWVFGIEGLGAQVEYNDFADIDNEVARLGLTFKHDIPSFTDKNGWFMWRGVPYETDGEGQQLSWIWFLTLADNISFSGFADLNLREGMDDRWVVEPALNFKLSDRCTFHIEYRHNEFEDDSVILDGDGVAFGFDMKF